MIISEAIIYLQHMAAVHGKDILIVDSHNASVDFHAQKPCPNTDGKTVIVVY